jgi:outer membrane protein TolC
MTIEQAVQRSQQIYPQIRISTEQIAAAAAGINLARTAYLPRIEGLAQVNRATRNNIYGMLLPQTVIAPISGPPNPTNAGTNVWGSAVGFLVSWEPFDFGLRQASVDAATAARKKAELTADRARFEVSGGAADAFLTVLAAEETVKAARAQVERARVFTESVNALVKAGLRPGAEAARAKAEQALAENQRIQAEQAVALARASLAQFLGSAPGPLTPPGDPPASDPAAAAAHPAVAEQTAAIDESKARLKVLDRSYFPKFQTQAATYARGTGANPNFTTEGGANGLGPNIYNWGLGFSVQFNVMEYASLRARKEIEAARTRTEAARLDQVKLDLNTQLERAKAQEAGARQILANTPIQNDAARAAEQQATARYKAGLGTITEVAEAQRLLTQAEIDMALARLGIWRAQLAVASAQGDLAPFLKAASGSGK